MAIYYVGSGGNDGNSGASWALRKLTLAGAEAIVSAGDTVYVGPGVYREALTCAASGTAGNPITYIGDYSGANTDGTGGVVRISTSNNDTSQTRTECIKSSSRNYRTFSGFILDGGTFTIDITAGTNWVIAQCFHAKNGIRGISIAGASNNILITNNYFVGGSYRTISISHSSTVDDANITIQNCVFLGPGGTNGRGVFIERFGGILVKNCYFNSSTNGVDLSVVPAAGQLVTVNNSFFLGCHIGVRSVTAGFVEEDYNNFTGNENNRSNVSVGANSNTFIFLPEARWFFEMVAGGNLITPFDLASYSGLINLAGTAPTATDMRGTGTIGAQREWGPLEYDPSLEAAAGSGSVNSVKISPFIGRLSP